jgi:EthD domain
LLVATVGRDDSPLQDAHLAARSSTHGGLSEEEATMIKLVFCCRRQPNLSRDEFQRYWLEEHGALVRSLRESIPQMVKYVQSHTLGDEINESIRSGRGSDQAYDGITEVWFEDLASFGSGDGVLSAAGRRLLEDEGTFLDLPRCSIFVTEEHEIF